MTQSPARTTGVYGPSGAVDFAGAEDFFVAFFAVFFVAFFAVFFVAFFAVFFTVFFAVFFAVAILPAYRATASARKWVIR
jgi:hypothetical protein